MGALSNIIALVTPVALIGFVICCVCGGIGPFRVKNLLGFMVVLAILNWIV